MGSVAGDAGQMLVLLLSDLREDNPQSCQPSRADRSSGKGGSDLRAEPQPSPPKARCRPSLSLRVRKPHVPSPRRAAP